MLVLFRILVVLRSVSVSVQAGCFVVWHVLVLSWVGLEAIWGILCDSVNDLG